MPGGSLDSIAPSTSMTRICSKPAIFGSLFVRCRQLEVLRRLPRGSPTNNFELILLRKEGLLARNYDGQITFLLAPS